MFMQLFPYSYNLAAINPLFFMCLSHFLINPNMFSDFLISFSVCYISYISYSWTVYISAIILYLRIFLHIVI